MINIKIWRRARDRKSWRKRKFDLNKNLTKNGFRRHTSKSPVDNKYKFCYTITTVKVWWTTKREQEAPRVTQTEKSLKVIFLKQSQFPLLRGQRRNAEKKIYLISEFSGRHNGYGLRARYIGSIPRNPLIRRHTSKLK